MKINIFGIVAGIMVFVSLVLPWWVLAGEGSYVEEDPVRTSTYTVSLPVYLYKTPVATLTQSVTGAGGWEDSWSWDWTQLVGFGTGAGLNFWFGWIALVLIIVGGVLAIVGSLLVEKGKILLACAGVFVLLSVAIFAIGLQNELSRSPTIRGVAGRPTIRFDVGLFSSGSFGYGGATVNYSTYLYIGFWLALVSAVPALVSIAKHPKK